MGSTGHKGRFGHEFLEFEFRPGGKLRYANNSHYKNETMIRKETFVSKSVMLELKRIIDESEIMREDDNNWPEPDRIGKQELEIVTKHEHISFQVPFPIVACLLSFLACVQLPFYNGVCIASFTAPICIVRACACAHAVYFVSRF